MSIIILLTIFDCHKPASQKPTVIYSSVEHKENKSYKNLDTIAPDIGQDTIRIKSSEEVEY